MDNDNIDTRITSLKEQREQIHESLGELVKNASDYTKSAPPELIRALDRVLEQANALLVQIEHGRDELDDLIETGAEEFVKNYIVKPGFREDSGWGDSKDTGSRTPGASDRANISDT